MDAGALDGAERVSAGLGAAPLPYFTGLLVVALVVVFGFLVAAWRRASTLQKEHAASLEAMGREHSLRLEALARESGATLVRLEHVLAGLLRLRDDYRSAKRKGAPDGG